jgi:hypothetical protein
MFARHDDSSKFAALKDASLDAVTARITPASGKAQLEGGRAEPADGSPGR